MSTIYYPEPAKTHIMKGTRKMFIPLAVKVCQHLQ